MKLDDHTLASLEGKFIQLSDGATYYEIQGESNAPVVVLVHGFSTPSYTWDFTMPALTTAGFNVLRYDIFGRGFSDRPKKAYDLQFCVAQLHELLDAVKISSPVHLVGLSYGGPVVASFTRAYPNSVSALALIDPLITKNVLETLPALNLPILGEMAMALYIGPFILPKAQINDFFQPERFPDWEARFRRQMRYRGFNRAILSAFRCIQQLTPEAEYQAVGRMLLPVLCLRGEFDQTISQDDINLLMKIVPQLQFNLIKNAGHIPHYEQPEVVNPILIDFLKSH